MSRTRRYLLHPRGAFHFGERGVGIEETAELLHSDTLFAALVSAWRMLGAQAGQDDLNMSLLTPFIERRPPLRISSALPFAGPVQLFPRPLLPLGIEKALKEVRYVSAGALTLIAQGARLTRERAEREFIQGGQVWVLAEERELIATMLLESERDPQRRATLATLWAREPARIKLWWAGDELVPHVSVDRRSAMANLFHTGRLRFAHGCGLAFWVVSDDDTYLTQLEAGLDFLQHEGLGGKRSAGYGQFTWQASDEVLPVAEAPNYHLTLSLYTPHPDEYGLLRDAWYRRMLRQGWIFSPEGRSMRRRGIWMLREGTVLPADPLGAMEDVQPEVGFAHPIWRYGYALTLPLRLEVLPDRARPEDLA